MDIKKLKIAIVCDWLTTMGGAEKVIIALHKLFPDAPIYTTIYNKDKIKGLEDAEIITSYLQHFPFAKKRHQYYLPLMPGVFESFDLNGYDLVISSSHSCAKGVITKPGTMHVSYCHSPMRYAWDNSLNYIKSYEVNGLLKRIAPFFIHKIRIWDRFSADRVDHFLANSKYVQHRIFKYYKKPSSVIYPFVDMDKYEASLFRKDYFLAVGRLTPYKKFDLIVNAFNKSGLPIKVIGTGISEKKLKKIAGPNIEFLGYTSDNELKKLYSEARALIFPQIEDFGIIPLEAMASGCPVIAMADGGALETIIDGKTGIFFHKQTEEALLAAIKKFENTSFDPEKIREHAAKFNEYVFRDKIIDYIEKKWLLWEKEMV